MPSDEPREVKISALLWLIAVAAGLFETGLAVLRALSHDSALDGGGAGGTLARLLVYLVAGVLIGHLRRGRDWARSALAVLLGGIGALPLVLGAVRWLFAGHHVLEILNDTDQVSMLFALTRLAHLAAVIAALLFMFEPKANAYFRPVHSGRNSLRYRKD
jgi:uncharacterized membrane protein YidH (DUF202 family)